MHLEERQRIVEELYIKMQSKVNGLCSRYIYNQHEREEVVQDVFMTLFKTLEQFDGRCKIETWLYALAKNQCLNHVRAVQAKKRKGIKVELTAWNGPSVRATQLEDLIAVEAAEKIDRAFANSGFSDFRSVQCFLMAKKDGLSYEEICDVLGLSNTTVRARVSRGKRFLKRRLQHYGPIV
jgi:RNA polymerase sigma-70 factor, ECF subfamily